MKIVYTNISPINGAYTNLNHIFCLKEQSPQKAYICVWDSFVFEHPLFSKNFDSSQTKMEKLQENIAILEKLLTYLEVDYKIIYISEAMNRLFKSPKHFAEFQEALSKIRVEDLVKGTEIKYIPFKEISLSRINLIIADYLVATYLPELYPEICPSQPTHYLTSERFRIFQEELNHSIKSNASKYSPPDGIFVTGVPVIMHPDEKIIPSLEMSKESIKRIVKAYYQKKPKSNEISDLCDVLLNALSTLSYQNKEIKKERLASTIEKMNYQDFIEFASINLYNYFSEINNITSKITIKKQKKSLFVSTYSDFNKQIKPLSDIKLEILKYCNGENSSLDISRKTGLNLSTVSTYLNHLKNEKIVAVGRKPKRLIDSFVIDLEAIEK